MLRDSEAEWLHESPLASGGDHLSTFAQHVRQVVRPGSVAELVLGVNHEVNGRFSYSPGSSYVSSTVDDLLERGTGVCQDFAHLMIATLRDLGVPARYVSGYFYAGPPGEIELDVARCRWSRTPGSRPSFPASAGGRSTRPTTPSPTSVT